MRRGNTGGIKLDTDGEDALTQEDAGSSTKKKFAPFKRTRDAARKTMAKTSSADPAASSDSDAQSAMDFADSSIRMGRAQGLQPSKPRFGSMANMNVNKEFDEQEDATDRQPTPQPQKGVSKAVTIPNAQTIGTKTFYQPKGDPFQYEYDEETEAFTVRKDGVAVMENVQKSHPAYAQFLEHAQGGKTSYYGGSAPKAPAAEAEDAPASTPAPQSDPDDPYADAPQSDLDERDDPYATSPVEEVDVFGESPVEEEARGPRVVGQAPTSPREAYSSARAAARRQSPFLEPDLDRMAEAVPAPVGQAIFGAPAALASGAPAAFGSLAAAASYGKKAAEGVTSAVAGQFERDRARRERMLAERAEEAEGASPVDASTEDVVGESSPVEETSPSTSPTTDASRTAFKRDE